MEMQAGEISTIKMQRWWLGETGNEHLVRIWRSREGNVQREPEGRRGCFTADPGKSIVCVAFNEVCLSSADVIIWMRKSS